MRNYLICFKEFPGTVDLEQSISEIDLVVVYPVKGEKCMDRTCYSVGSVCTITLDAPTCFMIKF